MAALYPKIRPDFNLSSFAHYSLFTNSYAQPIISLNYSKIIPSYQTPVKDVFLACMQQVLPLGSGRQLRHRAWAKNC